mgnify:CR=1 FL=1
MGDTTTRQRLAAILAADVSGYSRLMACDEQGTVTALDAAREVFARHIRAQQGRVIDGGAERFEQRVDGVRTWGTDRGAGEVGR